MKSTLQRIEEIKRAGYKLDLGEAINETFANYKKIALLAGAVLLLVFIAAIIIIGGITALILGVGAITETFTQYSMGQLSSTAFLVNLIASIIGAGLFAPITAGIIQMAHNAAVNEHFDFGTAFEHYKTEHFKELFLAAAIIALVGSGLGTLFQVANINYPEQDLLAIGTVVSSIISILIPIFTLVTIPLIIFGKLNAMDAIKGSFVVVSKNFWIILLLVIVCVVFIFFGLIAFCIGIIFTVPAMYSLQYILYRSALPNVEHDELEEIGRNYN